MVNEKHLNDIETANDILFDSIHKAMAVTEAIHELGKMDDIANYDLFTDPEQLKKPEHWGQYEVIHEIVRTHNTLTNLMWVLKDELEKIDNASENITKTLTDIAHLELTATNNGEAS